jgi:hypothetical protein
MEQSRIESAIESFINTASGFIIAVLLWQYVLPPILGIQASTTTSIGMTVFFTAITLARNYLWRRFFANGLHKVVHKAVTSCLKNKRGLCSPADERNDFGLPVVGEAPTMPPCRPTISEWEKSVDEAARAIAKANRRSMFTASDYKEAIDLFNRRKGGVKTVWCPKHQTGNGPCYCNDN